MKKDKRVCTVYQTTDYSKFKLLGGNRVINLQNLRRIKESMSEKQLLSVVIVNEKFEIIDGQHRFNACKELRKPIFYITCKGYGLKEVQVLNTNSANWKKSDYLNAYCDLGVPDYIRFREFMQLFPNLSLMVCYSLLSGTTNGSGNRVSGTFNTPKGKVKAVDKWFEKGEFKIKDWNEAVKSAEKIMMIKPYYDGYNRRSFVLAMMSMFKNKKYNHADLINKLGYQSVSLTDCTNTSQYKVLIEEIYNYRRSKKVNLRFAA